MEEVKKIINDIKKKDIKPIYFLMGEEPYYIDKISEFIADNVLNEEEKGFNQMVLYGKDVSINEIISNARRFPLMSDYQVLIIKEAQDLARTIEQFDSYFSNVQTTTILVFCYKYKTLDKRKKVFKNIEKHGVIFESKRLREYQIESWLKKILASKKYSIDPKATAMLVEFLGTDLSRISNEIDKLTIILPEGTMITPDHIEENIGISKEFNNFEFIKAIAEKNKFKAYQIAKYFADNSKNNPLVVTTSMIYNFFSKMLQYHGIIYKNNNFNPKDIARDMKVSEFFLKDYINGSKNYTMKQCSESVNLLRDMDVKSKGVGVNALSHHDLLIELLGKFFN